jgi:hypothetical protein
LGKSVLEKTEQQRMGDKNTVIEFDIVVTLGLLNLINK